MLHQKSGLFFLLVSFSASLADSVYKAKGEDAVLTPPSMVLPIQHIEWNYNEDIAADWHGKEFVCFGQFKDRCELNSDTGALIIKGLNLDDVGIYTPEINFKVLNKIELSVISRVAKPSVETSCNAEKTRCDMTCEGNTADAEPITLQWIIDGRDGPSDKVLTITEDTKQKSFICLMKNPVSNETSESITNPFIKELDLLALVFGVGVPLIVVIAAVAAFFICKHIKGTKYELQQQNYSKEQTGNTQPLSNGAEAQKYRYISYTSVPKDDHSGAQLTSVEVHNQQTSAPSDTNQDSRQSDPTQPLSNGTVASGTNQASVTQNGHSGAQTESMTLETSNQSPAEAGVSDIQKQTEKSALIPENKQDTNLEPSADEQEADDRGDVD